MTTTVTTQKELDKALKDPNVTDIDIKSPAGVWLELGDTGDIYVRAFGSASVRAFDSASVSASGSANVSAFDSANVSASGSASVRASGSASVSAFGSASVRAFDSANVSASDSASVSAFGSANVSAFGSASVRAFDSANVSAFGSASVRAFDSASVSASDSASVSAFGSASVSAFGSANVSASGSASVRAFGSASVRASGSASVRASGSASVDAGKYVAVHLHPGRATVTGGVLIDVTAIDTKNLDGWADYHSVDVVDGEAIVYKAVDDDLKSGRGFHYPIGATVTCPDWKADGECGQGLHFSPHPHQAKQYFIGATRFLKCAVPVKELNIIDGADTRMTPKLKAKTARVLAEVDIHSNPIKEEGK